MPTRVKNSGFYMLVCTPSLTVEAAEIGDFVGSIKGLDIIQ